MFEVLSLKQFFQWFELIQGIFNWCCLHLLKIICIPKFLHFLWSSADELQTGSYRVFFFSCRIWTTSTSSIAQLNLTSKRRLRWNMERNNTCNRLRTGRNWFVTQSDEDFTFNTLTPACIFSILFSIDFPKCWEELV